MSGPRLLLLRCDRLGDTVLALPAACALRAALPEAHITFCCRPENIPLVARCRGIDAVIGWTSEEGSALAAALPHCDGAAMLLPKPARLAWALRRSGIGVRVGSARRWWSWMFNHRVGGGRRHSGAHESAHNIRLAGALATAFGGTIPAEAPLPNIAFDDDSIHRAKALLDTAGLGGSGPLVVLHGGSRGSAKDWPLDSMVELAQRLLTDGCRVGWTVGPVDGQVRERVASQLGEAARWIVAPDVGELAAVLAQAHCVVANSTGPLHVAAVVGTPVVGLYPPLAACTPDRWGPLGPRSRVIVAPLKADEPNPLPRPAAAPVDLMARITVDQVYAVVREQLDCPA